VHINPFVYGGETGGRGIYAAYQICWADAIPEFIRCLITIFQARCS